MRESVMKLRRAAVAAVAALSVVMAVFLVWSLVTPARIGAAPLTGLLGVLALMVLPGATLAAWELDRRAASRIPSELIEDRDAAPSGAPEAPEVVTDLAKLVIAEAPDAPPRPARIHERPAVAAEPRHRHRIAGDRTRQN